MALLFVSLNWHIVFLYFDDSLVKYIFLSPHFNIFPSIERPYCFKKVKNKLPVFYFYKRDTVIIKERSFVMRFKEHFVLYLASLIELHIELDSQNN